MLYSFKQLIPQAADPAPRNSSTPHPHLLLVRKSKSSHVGSKSDLPNRRVE